MTVEVCGPIALAEKRRDCSMLRAQTTRITLHSTLFRSRGLGCLVASSSKPISLSLKRKRDREDSHLPHYYNQLS
uniref:Uncharacterized protein n=1 Tax=Trichogramma kaykai TaxID=54128 RepID=A0ABD2XHU0_9HYME